MWRPIKLEELFIDLPQIVCHKNKLDRWECEFLDCDCCCCCCPPIMLCLLICIFISRRCTDTSVCLHVHLQQFSVCLLVCSVVYQYVFGAKFDFCQRTRGAPPKDGEKSGVDVEWNGNAWYFCTSPVAAAVQIFFHWLTNELSRGTQKPNATHDQLANFTPLKNLDIFPGLMVQKGGLIMHISFGVISFRHISGFHIIRLTCWSFGQNIPLK